MQILDDYFILFDEARYSEESFQQLTDLFSEDIVFVLNGKSFQGKTAWQNFVRSVFQTNKDLKQILHQWILTNQQNDKTSILIGYSLGKAQRILKLVEDFAEIFVHSAIDNINQAIASTGLKLPDSKRINWGNRKEMQGKIVVVPPALIGSNMIKKIPNANTAVCSGWMQVRGNRRWKSVDAGFPISDHADWDGLLKAVKASEPEKVFVTHGSQAVFAKYLNEIGIEAYELKTQYGEQEESESEQLTVDSKQ